MTIADRMAVFLDGDIVQVGTPDEVFNRPDNLAVAAFIGSPPMNLLPARFEDGAVSIAGERIALARDIARAPGEVVVGIRPSHIRLADSGIPARVVLSENLGESMLINAETDGTPIKVRLPEVRRIEDGESVRLAFDPASIHLFDPETKRRID